MLFRGRMGARPAVPLPSGDLISADPLIFQGATSFSVRTGRTLVLPMITVYGES